jgi:hypothetical protein
LKFTGTLAAGVLAGAWVIGAAQQPPAAGQPARDPVADATRAKDVPVERPEQKQTEHDKSAVFDWTRPSPLSNSLKDQPNGGRIAGFELSRDPLGAQAIPDVR